MLVGQGSSSVIGLVDDHRRRLDCTEAQHRQNKQDEVDENQRYLYIEAGVGHCGKNMILDVHLEGGDDDRDYVGDHCK